MSKQQTLRDLVYERLTSAAEEIFALVERTIAEYEYELCRCREENRVKQQRLDLVLNPRIQLHKVRAAGVHVSSTSPPPPPPPDLGLNLDIMPTAQIKDEPEEPEEQGIKEEKEKQPVSSVKSEEPLTLLGTHPELQQTQTERPEVAQAEDINPELHLHSQTEESSDTDNNVDLAPAQMESHGDDCDQDQITEAKDMSKNNSKHQCSICLKTFKRNLELRRHSRVHTGERPYTCTVCTKTFNQNVHLKVHMRTHSNEKPYSCSLCAKTFTQKIHLDVHLRIHSNEKPYSCSLCAKTFTQKIHLDVHLRIHSGEKPYRCHVCQKTFRHNVYRLKHMATHSEAQHHD